MLVATGEEHFLENTTSGHVDLVAVHFHAHVFGSIDFLSLAGVPAASVASRDAPYCATSRNLAREYALRAPGWRRALESGLTQGLIHVMRAGGCSSQFPSHASSHRTLARLYPAMEHLERNLGNTDLGVGELARRVHLSEVQFRKLFKRVIGTTPVSFVRKRRMQLACALLRETDREIKGVAGECGFADAMFFSKVFKSLTGTTPAAYRNSVEP
jgi:AraC-like DNA-binding protein